MDESLFTKTARQNMDVRYYQTREQGMWKACVTLGPGETFVIGPSNISAVMAGVANLVRTEAFYADLKMRFLDRTLTESVPVRALKRSDYHKIEKPQDRASKKCVVCGGVVTRMGDAHICANTACLVHAEPEEFPDRPACTASPGCIYADGHEGYCEMGGYAKLVVRGEYTPEEEEKLEPLTDYQRARITVREIGECKVYIPGHHAGYCTLPLGHKGDHDE